MKNLTDDRRAAYKQLLAMGLHVDLAPAKCSYDLVISEDTRVEVKEAALSPRGGWQANIHRHGVVDESQVDMYVIVLRVPGVIRPEAFLLCPAPLGCHTVRITLRSLLHKWKPFIPVYQHVLVPKSNKCLHARFSSRTLASMAKPKKHKKVNMKPGDDGFFEKVGSLGGKTTKKRYGKEYFSKIASISHVKRAERRAAESQPTPAE